MIKNPEEVSADLLVGMRKGLGMTQAEVARQTGVSASLVGLIEQGRYDLGSPASKKVIGFILTAQPFICPCCGALRGYGKSSNRES